VTPYLVDEGLCLVSFIVVVQECGFIIVPTIIDLSRSLKNGYLIFILPPLVLESRILCISEPMRSLFRVNCVSQAISKIISTKKLVSNLEYQIINYTCKKNFSSLGGSAFLVKMVIASRHIY